MRVPPCRRRVGEGKCRREKQRPPSGEGKVGGVRKRSAHNGESACQRCPPRHCFTGAVRAAASARACLAAGHQLVLTWTAAGAAVAEAVAAALSPAWLAAVLQANDHPARLHLSKAEAACTEAAALRPDRPLPAAHPRR